MDKTMNNPLLQRGTPTYARYRAVVAANLKWLALADGVLEREDLQALLAGMYRGIPQVLGPMQLSAADKDELIEDVHRELLKYYGNTGK